MPAKKLYKFADSQLDRQIEEIVHYQNRPQCTELPVYSNNANAKIGGLSKGQFYRTATGSVMVVY